MIGGDPLFSLISLCKATAQLTRPNILGFKQNFFSFHAYEISTGTAVKK